MRTLYMMMNMMMSVNEQSRWNSMLIMTVPISSLCTYTRTYSE